MVYSYAWKAQDQSVSAWGPELVTSKLKMSKFFSFSLLTLNNTYLENAPNTTAAQGLTPDIPASLTSLTMSSEKDRMLGTYIVSKKKKKAIPSTNVFHIEKKI